MNIYNQFNRQRQRAKEGKGGQKKAMIQTMSVFGWGGLQFQRELMSQTR